MASTEEIKTDIEVFGMSKGDVTYNPNIANFTFNNGSDFYFELTADDLAELLTFHITAQREIAHEKANSGVGTTA